jgi:hypothetical protein
MYNGSMQNPLESARAQLTILVRERDDLNLKIGNLTHAISLMVPVFEQESNLVNFEDPNVGLTDRIRAILRMSPGHSLTPTEIKAYVEGSGYDLSKHSNGMAMIHQVLRRLHASDEIEHVQGDGKSGYRWLGKQ